MTRMPQIVTYSTVAVDKGLKQNKVKPQKNHDASTGTAVVGKNARLQMKQH